VAFRNRSPLAVSAALAPVLAPVAACSGASGQGNGSAAAGSHPIVSLSGPGPGADQAVFKTNAAAGSGAFGGLEADVIVAALLMAAGSAWGLSRRLAEYR
jgi:hypothetical protein